MKNGVKQGGILSPKLFIVYINEIFEVLQASGLGCWIGSEYCGIMGYADDLVLLAASKHDLDRMLAICTECASKLDLLFNPEKSVYMVFGDSKRDDRVILNESDQLSYFSVFIDLPRCTIYFR